MTAAVPWVALLLAAVVHAADAASTDNATTSPSPPPTTTPPPTPSPWIKLAVGCTSATATKMASLSSYAGCQRDSAFTFELANAPQAANENPFCSSPACLQLYRALTNESESAVFCANVPMLQNTRLDTVDGPAKCFGADAAAGKSDVIVRPSKSGSGSGDAKTTAPPPTTAAPTTTTGAPTPSTPEPTTASPGPAKTPKPSKTPQRGTAGSGSSFGNVTLAPSDTNGSHGTPDGSGGMDTGTVIAIVSVSIGVVAVVIALVYVSTRKRNKRRAKHRTNRSTYSGGETVSHEQLQSYYGEPTRPSGALAGRASGVGGRGSLAARPSGLTGGGAAARASQLGLVASASSGGHGSSHSGSAWNSGSASVGTAFDGWDEELIAAVRIPYEKLTFDELMSRGGYGEVYRGTYRGELVAIKTLLPERRRDMQQIQNFLAEVKMMANMEHERIVRFIGVAWDSLEELSVVSEFLERGDLRTVLSGFEKNNTCPHGFDGNKVKIALHVAHGLTYMHTLQPIVLHRDLKSRNILLDAELNAKITDFGVSRERSDRTMTAGVGSSLWMAPEVMMGERYDEKADVFSFGVVLSELDNHVLPYSHAIERATGRRMPDAVILQMVSQGRIRVEFTNEAHSEMAHIGMKCVALSPKDRPTSAELLHLIHQVWRRYCR